ncbi:MAG: hypothetical protein OER90_12065 [Gemmatimonadota bacterium]|nr:hypothetical protein [Gemmatimonadota bacterium]
MSSRHFRLPPPERGNPWWGVASLVLHVIVIAVLVAVAGPTFVGEERVTLVTLVPPGSAPPRQLDMPAYGGVPSGGGGRPGARVVGIVPSARIDTMLPPPGPAFLLTDLFEPVSDSIAVPSGTADWRLIGARYGDGRLWVRTMEAQLGVVGPSPDVATHVARVERAVRDRMKAYIDTMPRDSFAIPAPPTWTTEVAGNTWGIDRNWIYLGDFKIPTALLALLPLPQGNIEQAQAAAEMARMRQDIIEAARRAETAEEFRGYVEQLRRRKDEEREAERARAAVRDTIKP